MLSSTLGLDEKDVIIVSTLCRQPQTSQADLAQMLGLSQPSVNVRIHKLRERGVLSHVTGIEFNRTGMAMVRVDCAAADPADLLRRVGACSFFVNAFTMSGTRNVSMLIVGHSLGKVESIINEHIRSAPGVLDIATSVVVDTAKPFVCQIDLMKERHESCRDPSGCQNCPLHSSSSKRAS